MVRLVDRGREGRSRNSSRAAVWTDKERLEEKEDGHVHFRVYRGVNMELYRMKM
jgi:hypothetical protein